MTFILSKTDKKNFLQDLGYDIFSPAPEKSVKSKDYICEGRRSGSRPCCVSLFMLGLGSVIFLHLMNWGGGGGGLLTLPAAKDLH